MTSERAKELLPVIQAYAEGKPVQYRKTVYPDGIWRNVTAPNFGAKHVDWRIKPEKKSPGQILHESCGYPIHDWIYMTNNTRKMWGEVAQQFLKAYKAQEEAS